MLGTRSQTENILKEQLSNKKARPEKKHTSVCSPDLEKVTQPKVTPIFSQTSGSTIHTSFRLQLQCISQCVRSDSCCSKLHLCRWLLLFNLAVTVQQLQNQLPAAQAPSASRLIAPVLELTATVDLSLSTTAAVPHSYRCLQGLISWSVLHSSSRTSIRSYRWQRA